MSDHHFCLWRSIIGRAIDGGSVAQEDAVGNVQRWVVQFLEPRS